MRCDVDGHAEQPLEFYGLGGGWVSGSSTLQLTMNSNITEQAVFGTTLSVQESDGPVQVSAGQGSYPQGRLHPGFARAQPGDFFLTARLCC